jgi:tetratricopeptide (TPR) repeat protein
VRSVVVVVSCVIAAACAASMPSPRPLQQGFATTAGVADPYGDGKHHLAAGRYELAVQRFGQALASDRRALGALNGIAIAYTRLGRFDIAQTYFERALRIDPTDTPTLNNYGWSLSEQGRLREARPFLELALRHAEQADAPVIAGNIESLRRAPRSALVAVLESERAQRGAHRLVRVDEDAHRLETVAKPAGRPEPASAADDALTPDGSLRGHGSAVPLAERQAGADRKAAPSAATAVLGGTGAPPASVEALRAVRPRPDLTVAPRSGAGPIRLWSEPAPGASPPQPGY